MTAEAPDMIDASGRETLPFDERLVLLQNDALWLRQQSTSGAEVHDACELTAWAADLAYYIERARARGEDPQPRVLEFLSHHECRFLAWRRGGHLEAQRVMRAHYARKRTKTP